MTIDFEALLTDSPNPYVVLDRSLRITWTNDAYLRATMRERADIIGVPMFEAFPSDPESESHRLLENSFKHVFATGESDEIALIRYDIPRPDGSMDVRYWSSTHTPVRNQAGDVSYLLQHTVDVTELHGLRAMREEIGVIKRADAVQARNLDLSEETHQLKALFEQAPGFIAILSGPEHRFQMVNEAYRTLVGRRDLIAKTLAQALPEVIEQGFADLLDQVRDTRQPFVGRRMKVELTGTQSDLQERFLDFLYQPIFSDEGQVSGIFVQGHDVTDQVEAEERQKLLMNELNHRVKNTLAIVQGLAAQTFRTLDGSEDARRTFNLRLGALASAHDLLTRSNWEAAGLLETIKSAVEAVVELERFTFNGRDWSLVPQTAVSLAMIIHELCTNAVKYGALSVPEGRVAIHWTVEEIANECMLTLCWTERDGPPVTTPTRSGFGSRLIKHGFSAEHSSTVSLAFEPEGLICTIAARLPRPTA